jgi:hypothetical protein
MEIILLWIEANQAKPKEEDKPKDDIKYKESDTKSKDNNKSKNMTPSIENDILTSSSTTDNLPTSSTNLDNPTSPPDTSTTPLTTTSENPTTVDPAVALGKISRCQDGTHRSPDGDCGIVIPPDCTKTTLPAGCNPMEHCK